MSRTTPQRTNPRRSGRAAPPAAPTASPAAAPGRETRDRTAQHRKLGRLKRVAIGVAVVAFGSGWALVGHNAVGVTSQTAEGATGSGITSVPGAPGTVLGLGQPDSRGFFTFQSGVAQQSGASASRVSRTRPSFRSRSS